MLPIKELHNLMERLNEKNRDLKIEIQLITAWIKEHRENRPACTELPPPGSDERNEYRTWRKVSCRLHQRRSELKSKHEKPGRRSAPWPGGSKRWKPESWNSRF